MLKVKMVSKKEFENIFCVEKWGVLEDSWFIVYSLFWVIFYV